MRLGGPRRVLMLSRGWVGNDSVSVDYVALCNAVSGVRAFRGGTSRAELDAVLTEAVERTGLEDFGSDDFRERLALWVGEVDDDPERTAAVVDGLVEDGLAARDGDRLTLPS